MCVCVCVCICVCVCVCVCVFKKTQKMKTYSVTWFGQGVTHVECLGQVYKGLNSEFSSC